jgi:5-methylcytosine-specific restriction endonuclease McrA
VWTRDGGRCVFPLPDGTVCGSTKRVQIDHIVAVAVGGTSEHANLRLTCACHTTSPRGGRSGMA